MPEPMPDKTRGELTDQFQKMLEDVNVQNYYNLSINCTDSTGHQGASEVRQIWFGCVRSRHMIGSIKFVKESDNKH